MSHPFVSLDDLVELELDADERGAFARGPRRVFDGGGKWEVGSRCRVYRRASRSRVRSELRAICAIRSAA